MSTEELKIGRMARDASATQIEIRRADDGKLITLSFSASSEAPVERWFGTEVLSHDPKAIRMDRLQGGAAPLLWNHNWDDPVGMVTGARIKDGRLIVDAQMFATARAAEVTAMVEGGLRNVSIGYEIEELTEDTKRNVFTATRWNPLEVSVVTVPADPSVGIGRSDDATTKTVRMLRAAESLPTAAAAASHERLTMSEVQTAAAGNTAAPVIQVTEDNSTRMSAMEVETMRRSAIQNLAKANNIDPRTEVDWIRTGAQLDKVAKEILDIQVQRQQDSKSYQTALGLSTRETKQYSIFRAMRTLTRNAAPAAFSDAAFEMECSRELSKKIGREHSANIFVPVEVLQRTASERAERTMTTTPGSKGGYAVDVQNMGFIDILRNRSVCYKMGATPMPGLVGNAAFVRQTGSPSITWQAGDAATVTAADQTLGQLSMTPKTAIVITDVSEQLLRQSSPSAEAFVMGDLAKSLSIAVDSAAINGTGGAQPLGIKNTAGITSGQDAASVTWAKIRAFWAAAAGANAVLSRPGWVTTSAGASLLSGTQRFTSTDTPIWEGNPSNGTVWGFPAMSSEQIASGNLIFGSWENLLIGEWGILELATDNGGTRFNNATVGIRAMWMVDTLLRYPQSFVVSTNLS